MEKFAEKPLFSSRNCISCGKCMEACPRNAIKQISFLWHKHVKPVYFKCIGCNRCVDACPMGCFQKRN
ncbi:MAG: 4Fe-4S binding protein [Muribaculaceae bacterium]|nr:4Fe-4S binding protein [Muribaculaceae bacterium]